MVLEFRCTPEQPHIQSADLWLVDCSSFLWKVPFHPLNILQSFNVDKTSLARSRESPDSINNIARDNILWSQKFSISVGIPLTTKTVFLVTLRDPFGSICSVFCLSDLPLHAFVILLQVLFNNLTQVSIPNKVGLYWGKYCLLLYWLSYL